MQFAAATQPDTLIQTYSKMEKRPFHRAAGRVLPLKARQGKG